MLSYMIIKMMHMSMQIGFSSRYSGTGWAKNSGVQCSNVTPYAQHRFDWTGTEPGVLAPTTFSTELQLYDTCRRWTSQHSSLQWHRKSGGGRDHRTKFEEVNSSRIKALLCYFPLISSQSFEFYCVQKLSFLLCQLHSTHSNSIFTIGGELF